MSVNLDGYNIPRKSTLKSDLEKRIDRLEESVIQLATVLEGESCKVPQCPLIQQLKL